MKKKKETVERKLINFFCEFGVYVVAVIGVLFSKYLPMIMETGDISTIEIVIPRWSEVLFANIGAAIVTYMMERKGMKAGKIRAVKRRFFSAFAYGFCWYYLVQEVIKGLSNG